MACSGRGGITVLPWIGLFLLVSSFCHCTTLTRLKALDKRRGNATLSQDGAKRSDLLHGKLLIGQNSLRGAKPEGADVPKTDYQADMGWEGYKHPKGQGEDVLKLRPDADILEQLLKMEPKVECTVDSMKLQVQGAASTPGSLLFVDRGIGRSPLPLSKLPPSCGYTVSSTQRELLLMAPYDGCFVALEENNYVLPLRWWGVPVRMSCPLMRLSSPNPPMVTCHTAGMVVKTEWMVPVAKININLNGTWEPLMMASSKCGFSVVVHPEGVVISVNYAPCLENKGGLYIVELTGDGETKISCPSLSATQTVFTPSHNSVPSHSPTLIPQSVSQVSDFAQKPEAPNEKPKDISELPYFPFHPSVFHPYTSPSLVAQSTLPPFTKKDELHLHPTVHPPKLSVAPEGQVPQHFQFPFYHWLVQPEKTPVGRELPLQPPATTTGEKGVNPFYLYLHNVNPETKPLPTSSGPAGQITKGQKQQPYYPFPFHPQQSKSETPPTPAAKTSQSELETVPLYPPFTFGLPQKSVEPPTNQPEKQKPFYPFPPYPQPPLPASQVKENMPPKPPATQEPQGQKYQQLYYPLYHPFWPQGLFQTQMPLTEPTSMLAPKGKGQQPLGPLEPFKPNVPGDLLSSNPTPQSKEPSQPEPPQGHVYQYPYPLFPHLVATENSTTDQPSQSEAPRGQVYQYPYHLFPQPAPTEKPTTVKQSSEPEAPQGQLLKYPYPLFPQPVPTEKPTTVRQPEAPQGLVYPYPYHLFPQPAPTEKPTTVQQPSEPEAPQSQVYQYPYPLFPQPVPTEKPTTAGQPEAPQGLVYQYPYHLFPQPAPTEKPTTVKQSSEPEAPQGQLLKYPYPLFPQPVPTEKPTTVRQPEAPQGLVYQYPYHLFPQPVPTEKPTTVKQSSEPEAPQGQLLKYPYPLFPQPVPTEKPTTVGQPEAPQGLVYQYPYSLFPHLVGPKNSTTVQQPSQPEAPRGQEYQYPYHLFPQLAPSEKPSTVTEPEAPQGQLLQYPYPLFPQPVPTEKPTTVKQPEAPQSQAYQYPYPLLPQLAPTEKPTTVQQPSEPEAPQSQVYQYPYPLFPQPVPTEKPATVLSPHPGGPWGQGHLPFYPSYPFYLQPKPENWPATKPVPKPSYQKPYKIPDAGTNGAKAITEKPFLGENLPDSQVHHPFISYYSNYPQSPMLPPGTFIQKPQMATITEPSNGVAQQNPQPGSYIPSLHCPQFCPSGISNCCVQIAFHQHLHHIIPPVFGDKLPYSDVPPQKPTETTQAPVSAPSSSQAPPSENEEHAHFLPPDGNPAVINISKKPINPQLPVYPYFVPNSVYRNWPYLPQNEMKNLPQSQSATDFTAPFKPLTPGSNPGVQYEPYHMQPPEQQLSQQSAESMYNLSGPNFMSFLSRYQKQEHASQKSQPGSKDLQPSTVELGNSKGWMDPKGQSQLNHFLIPVMLQDAQAPAYNLSQPQTFGSSSEKSTEHDSTVPSHSKSKSYMLLQHGPPGNEPKSFHESPLPLSDVVHDPNLHPQNPVRHQSFKSQTLNLPQDRFLHLKHLGKKDPFSEAHLQPDSLKDVSMPVPPLGSSRRIPAPI